MTSSSSDSAPCKRDLLQLLRLGTEIERRAARRKLFTLYPDEGPLRRELYPKHMEFFALGAEEAERLFLAANRIGKTEGAGGYETALHLTGLYPHWWPGRRFRRAIRAWGASETNQLVREVMQEKLLGPVDAIGTGLIPGERIVRLTKKGGGVPDAFDSVYVRHVSGGTSLFTFKSYEMGREAFQGTKRELVWFDEEPDMGIYIEGLTRTMATGPDDEAGIVMCTFTPLKGVSEVVMHFLPDGLPATSD